ncbi:MAG: amino acid ABC transporter permease [Sneathiella sp.]|uniref:amino acid ABC transporter permease n=1 Tax=Sneathiella sp. TaxID=1964365 RepID=UPI000C5698A7|nr:amino acid ABC transporter permease [Sneathiella sp.]MAZ04575.1 amino acid ABC transporter permease [Sneathiella sp.]
MEFRFFEIYRSGEYLSLLAEGAGLSAALAIGGGLMGLTLATLLASFRYSKIPVLQQISTGYTEFIRNTPLIVQLFIVAFGLPLLLGYQWPFWGHALLALTINFSAYFAEILRAGFNAVPNGQIEAAASLGLKKPVIFRKIIFPQAVAMMYPSLNSQFIFLFLTTGVIAEIGVRDLMYAGLFIDSRTFRSFEVFFTITVIYILMALLFKTLLQLIHRGLFKWKVTR